MKNDDLAIQVLTKQIVSAMKGFCLDLPYDKTVEAKVVRLVDATSYKYSVSWAGKEFIATDIHGNSHNAMDTVWVLFPCGDMTRALII